MKRKRQATLKKRRSKRMQWFLVKSLESCNKESKEASDDLSMEELSDSGWFSEDSGGPGLFDFLKDSEEGVKGTWESLRKQSRLYDRPEGLCVCIEGFYYTLYGVIVHVGRTGSGGHWLCYIKSGETWTCYNDAQVPEHCLEELVLIQQAYMMFYVKSKIPEAPVSRNHSGINVPEGIARDEVWPVVRNTSAQINEASSHVAPPNQQSPESLEHLVGLLDEVGAGFVSSQSSQPDTVLNIEERSETPPTR